MINCLNFCFLLIFFSLIYFLFYSTKVKQIMFQELFKQFKGTFFSMNEKTKKPKNQKLIAVVLIYFYKLFLIYFYFILQYILYFLFHSTFFGELNLAMTEGIMRVNQYTFKLFRTIFAIE